MGHRCIQGGQPPLGASPEALTFFSTYAADAQLSEPFGSALKCLLHHIISADAVISLYHPVSGLQKLVPHD